MLRDLGLRVVHRAPAGLVVIRHGLRRVVCAHEPIRSFCGARAELCGSAQQDQTGYPPACSQSAPSGRGDGCQQPKMGGNAWLWLKVVQRMRTWAKAVDPIFAHSVLYFVAFRAARCSATTQLWSEAEGFALRPDCEHGSGTATSRNTCQLMA